MLRTTLALRSGSHLVISSSRSKFGAATIGQPRSPTLLRAASGISGVDKQRVVFLGSPAVAAESLQLLHDASAAVSNDSCYEIVSVVTQPPAPAGRKKKLRNCPVHDLANELQLPILTPQSARDEEFLTALEDLKIDLCITAAYGQFLPTKFLSIPRVGTVNIHPSLLPLYRGAAPVQRCLENGDTATGVSVAFTVLKMDAGPILAQLPYPLHGDEKAPQVLSDCFAAGTKKLIELLPAIFDGTAPTQPQDDAAATAAPKLSATDALIDFRKESAASVHNKCRAYAEWPGIYSYFAVRGSDEPARIKIITTKLLSAEADAAAAASVSVSDMTVAKVNGIDMLQVTCGDGSRVGIVELQPEGKKVMPVKAYLNGLRGNTEIRWVSPLESDSSVTSTISSTAAAGA